LKSLAALKTKAMVLMLNKMHPFFVTIFAVILVIFRFGSSRMAR